MMLKLKSGSRIFRKGKNSRGQVFILATLLIVVYSISIVTVVTELSVQRYKKDEINLHQILNEYLEEIEFQLKKSLYKYTTDDSVTLDTIILDLEKFQGEFMLYASLKGVHISFNPKYDEFDIIAKKNSEPLSLIDLTNDYVQNISIYLNSSVTLQSANSASVISGIFTHFYGIQAFISASTPDTITFTQITNTGLAKQYITGIVFLEPSAPEPVDLGNGSYVHSDDFEEFHVILTSGIEFLS